MREILLCDLKKGERAVIKKVNNMVPLCRRLFDIGFVEGTVAECVRISPAGDPKAYLVRGTVTALRNKDAAKIVGEALE